MRVANPVNAPPSQRKIISSEQYVQPVAIQAADKRNGVGGRLSEDSTDGVTKVRNLEGFHALIPPFQPGLPALQSLLPVRCLRTLDASVSSLQRR